MNAQKWMWVALFGIQGVAAMLFISSLVENLANGGPRAITVNAVRGPALIGVQALLYGWIWQRRK